MTAGDDQKQRPWITAKGLRALGRPVPDDVPDDEIVILHVEEAP